MIKAVALKRIRQAHTLEIGIEWRAKPPPSTEVAYCYCGDGRDSLPCQINDFNVRLRCDLVTRSLQKPVIDQSVKTSNLSLAGKTAVSPLKGESLTATRTNNFCNISETVYDRLFFYENLQIAWKEVKARANLLSRGESGITVFEYGRNANITQENLLLLEQKLISRSYKPYPYHAFTVLKSNHKKRPILSPDIEDRIVQRILSKHFYSLLAPMINNSASFGCLKSFNKKQKTTPIEKVISKIRLCCNEGFIYLFESDIENFFPTIDRELLLTMLKPYMEDDSLNTIIEHYINYEIGNLSTLSASERELFIEEGIAQGCIFSPLLANFYLHDFDEYFLQQKDCVLIRYMDDLVILCKTSERRNHIEKEVQNLLNLKKLSLKKCKTFKKKIDEESFSFLGLEINMQPSVNTIRVEKKKIENFRTKLKNMFSKNKRKYVFDRKTARRKKEDVPRKELVKHVPKEFKKWLTDQEFKRDDAYYLVRNICQLLAGWYGYYNPYLTKSDIKKIVGYTRGLWVTYFKQLQYSRDIPSYEWFRPEFYKKDRKLKKLQT